MTPNILHTADWHFGHHRVPTIDTVNDIRRHIFPRLVETDIMIVAGDIFDHEITFNNPDSNIIINFFIV